MISCPGRMHIFLEEFLHILCRQFLQKLYLSLVLENYKLSFERQYYWHLIIPNLYIPMNQDVIWIKSEKFFFFFAGIKNQHLRDFRIIFLRVPLSVFVFQYESCIFVIIETKPFSMEQTLITNAFENGHKKCFPVSTFTE